MATGRLTRFSRVALIALGAIAMLTAGCGSTTSTGIGASDIVRIRTVDTVPNGGNAAININNGTVAGSQTFFSGSDYRFLQPGAATVTFTFDVNTTTYQSVPETLLGATTYSAIVFGRTDVTDSADARFPSAIVAQDHQTAAAAGTADLRIIIAAPDAPNVDVLVNGAVVASNVAFKTVVPYANYPAGSVSVSIVNHATSAVLVAATPVTLGTGHSVSAYFVEPTVKTTVAAPTYQISTLVDF
ncbi:MAG TPA: DUF4397 domain-containing protein [Capsulimonadaceae bacterium]|jgi:hypothetical protein